MFKLTEEQEEILLRILGDGEGTTIVALVNMWMRQNYHRTFDYAWTQCELAQELHRED